MRTIQQAAANLAASVAIIPARYRQGVEAADWVGPASSDASEALWAQRTAEAAAAKRRQAGVRRVGNEVWRSNAANLGAPIIGQRITAAIGKYTTNFTPVLAAMQDAVTRLAPKGTDITQNVMNRVVPVAMAASKASPKRSGTAR